MRRKTLKGNNNSLVLGVLIGGLGNQLFIIFTTINYALKYKKNYLFYNSERRRKVFIDNIIYTESLTQGYKYVEEEFLYKEILNKKKILLHGYFQSYKYFDERKKEIFNLIFKNINIPSINKFNKFNTFFHFRIGDYKNYDCHPIQSVNYYIEALKILVDNDEEKEGINCVYFYELANKDEVDAKIMILKDRFPKINFTSIYEIDNSLSDIQQILLMSTFKNSIIANSTFSWWGAYLNENKNKNIFYPSKWFSGSLSKNNTSDLFPSDWKQITCA